MAAAVAEAGGAKVHHEEEVGFLAQSNADGGTTAAVHPPVTEAAVRRGSNFRLGRRFVLLSPIALVSMVLAVWGMSNPPEVRRWLHGSVQGLWLFRGEKPGEEGESIADCVFDSQFAVQNMMAFGLSVAGAANSCPASQKADDKAKEKWIDGAKLAHKARMNAIFGPVEEKHEHKGDAHGIASAALQKVQKVLAKYKKSEVKSKKDKQKAKFQAAMKSAGESVQAYEAAETLAKVAAADDRICAADISGVLSRMSYATSNIAALTSECRTVFDQKAYCTADITRLLAGVTMMASAGAEISATCTDYKKYIGGNVADDEVERRLDVHVMPATPVNEMFKGLQTFPQDKAAEKKARDTALTNCVTAAWFSATFFARFLDMNPAVKHCGPNGRGKAHCAAAIIDIISSMSWTASSISYAVASCPLEAVSEDVGCAAAITKLVAAIADTAAALSVVAPTCLNNSTKDTSR